jgi:hypothetical protein
MSNQPGAGYGAVNREQFVGAIRTRFSNGTDSLTGLE